MLMDPSWMSSGERGFLIAFAMADMIELGCCLGTCTNLSLTMIVMIFSSTFMALGSAEAESSFF